MRLQVTREKIGHSGKNRGPQNHSLFIRNVGKQSVNAVGDAAQDRIMEFVDWCTHRQHDVRNVTNIRNIATKAEAVIRQHLFQQRLAALFKKGHFARCQLFHCRRVDVVDERPQASGGHHHRKRSSYVAGSSHYTNVKSSLCRIEHVLPLISSQHAAPEFWRAEITAVGYTFWPPILNLAVERAL